VSNVSSLAKPSRTTRSAVSNGSRLHAGEVDGRSEAARRFRDVLSEIVSDLGGGETLSEGQRQLARRAAMMSVEAERMEAEAVAGGKLDPDAFGALSDRLGRVFNRLGLRRVAKTVGPRTMVEYAAMLREKNGGVAP
jgi:hypothetical protein